MRTGIVICTLVLAIALSLFLIVAGRHDRDDCDADDVARKIRGCTRVIGDASETVRDRALALIKRGLAYTSMRDFDRAIGDFNESISLNPNDPLAFNERGIAYKSKGDLERAVADYDEAIKIDPKYADIFYNRGNARVAKGELDRAIADYSEAISLGSGPVVATTEDNAITRLRSDRITADYFGARALVNFLSGNFNAAASDYARVVQLKPGDAYAVIWHYLAQARSGNNTGAAALRSNRSELKQPDWPFPVVELYLGDRTPQAIIAAATKPEERCEAEFYIGEWYLLRADGAVATVALKSAVDICPEEFLEYRGAQAELKRLGQ